MIVRRTLPHRTIRTVGAFCFVDHYGPAPVTGPGAHPMVVPPHPHCGLQTVSWLLSGEVEHRDSVGSVQHITPGELNLMTAGVGIAHSEYSAGADPLHGFQLWVALPDDERHQAPHFEHHAGLPELDVAGMSVRVVMGEVDGQKSPAQVYSPLVCAELRLPAGAFELPLDTAFEHGLLLADGDVAFSGSPGPRSALQYFPEQTPVVRLSSETGATVLLIGGEPFPEELLMWWNFVGRSHDEIVRARNDWAGGVRFGAVIDDVHSPMPAPDLPITRLKSRPGRRVD
jgi:redox-sensitive bicupin YhaK (pirin superfamily)